MSCIVAYKSTIENASIQNVAHGKRSTTRQAKQKNKDNTTIVNRKVQPDPHMILDIFGGVFFYWRNKFGKLYSVYKKTTQPFLTYPTPLSLDTHVRFNNQNNLDPNGFLPPVRSPLWIVPAVLFFVDHLLAHRFLSNSSLRWQEEWGGGWWWGWGN